MAKATSVTRPDKSLGKASLKTPPTQLQIRVDELTVQLAEMQKPILDAAAKWAEAMRPMMEVAQRIQAQMAEITTPLRPIVEHLNREGKKYRRLEKLGWMPHKTAPWTDLENENITDEDLADLIVVHYKQNWPAIKEQFLTSISDYNIDEEAKATFQEALHAHRYGLFRCAARLLFPEIERVSRVEIHAGAMDKMASQDILRKKIGELSPSELASSGLMGLQFYAKLVKHLYAHIKDDEALKKIVMDPVPNRHATVHGYASYKSLQSSVNSLILGDFIFNAISTIKNLHLESESGQ